MEKQSTKRTTRRELGLGEGYTIMLDNCEVYKNTYMLGWSLRKFWNRAYRKATNHEIIVAKLKGKLYE